MRREHLIDKTGTAQFSGEAMTKNLFKTFLMMIITVSAGVIYSSNIKYRVKLLQNL